MTPLEAEDALIKDIKARGLFDFGLADVTHIPNGRLALGSLRRRHVIKVTDKTLDLPKAERRYTFVPLQYVLFKEIT